MLCPNCGRIIDNNAPFCHHCGITIETSEQKTMNDTPKSAYWKKRPPAYKRPIKAKRSATDIFLTVFVIFIAVAIIVLAALILTGN